MTHRAYPTGEATVRKAEADAHHEVDRLAVELRRVLLDVAWRQWRAIGAGAVGRSSVRDAERRHLNTIVDPEALMLISLLLVREERRMPGLLHDWALENSDLLSVQRVKNLESEYPEPLRTTVERRVAWFARVARDEAKDLRWRSLIVKAQEGPGTIDDVVARTRTDAPEGSSRKMRATRVRATSGPTLLLRLRLAFGVGVKADLLAYVLARGEDWATVRDITDATGYTVAAVRRAAEDLAAARFIEALEDQPTSYRAVVGAWGSLLTLDELPRWGSWQERFVFAAVFLQWADAVGDRSLSWYAFGNQGRQLLERHRTAFERDLIAVWSGHSSIQDWGLYVTRSVRSLASWMSEMA